MKQSVALLALLLLLIMTVGGNLAAEDDPMLNGSGGIGNDGGGGGVEDDPDGDDHPWGGDQLPGGDTDVTPTRVKQFMWIPITSIPQIDYFLTGYYLGVFELYNPEPVSITRYYTRILR